MADALREYRKKRDFAKSPEPAGAVRGAAGALAYVIQKHAATRLHYDLRLELDGVMLSWAVPKGPSFDPKEKRMAVRVEDHPLEYNRFEGEIPRGQYGAGTVIVWDRGTWEPVGDPQAGLEAGKLVFKLHGQKLAGLWELVRIGKPGDRQMAWILFKKRDAFARPLAEYDVVRALPDSVVAKPLAPPLPSSAGAGNGADAAPRVPARARDLPGAVRATPPDKLAPQLATLSAGVPTSGDWIFEIKFDGYRLLARYDAAGAVRLLTRGGHDWTAKMPALAEELRALGLRSTWLDGEIVVLDDKGLPDFNALQNAFDQRAPGAISYFLFDVPFFDGHDLRAVPLALRRRFLQARLADHAGARVRFSDAFAADAPSLLQSAQRLGLEGVMAKRADAPYVSARTDTWLKLKVRQRQEFVVVGFADRGNQRRAAEIGSLQLAVYDARGRTLVPAGSVGTGWDARTAAALKQRLLPLETKTPPAALENVAGARRSRWSKRPADTIRWVKPTLVAEVNFAEWTPDGQIRHAVFVGLRDDLPAKKVRREAATTPAGALPLAASTLRISHPERIVDPASGTTKRDVVRYYESVAEWMLPHLRGRPCSFVRAPGGITGQLFFQKHDQAGSMPAVRRLPAALWPEHEPLLEVPDAQALLEAAQMNVLEFHTWNAKADKIDRPDRMIFDLDPGAGVTWKRMQEAALLVRGLLEELELAAWLKTSGGKGLHVVVPLAPRDGWDAVRALSEQFVRHLARVLPDRFVAVSGERNRVGKIFVDYLRNGHGATTAAAFSVRARPGLGVSMPVAWDDLMALKRGDQWTVQTAREHLSFQSVDPWAGYWTCRQSGARARKLLKG